ncbi:ABC transporter ATP-binding protein [Pseudobacillus badius]|uniref:ABC transporter ATP-binding protein n=1 Tax=Bacillus badius TaxID=1455 RepID=UPI003CF0CBE6
MLTVNSIEKSYKRGAWFSKDRQQILTNVCFECRAGECLGIVGESGSGKSTLGRLILGIEKPDRGTVLFAGQNIENRRARLGTISAVFQDYRSSLNPFFTVETAMMEAMNIKKKPQKEKQNKMDMLLNQVGLNASYKNRYPHELSGGEAQRVCIARALAAEPQCLVLDEAISSLDVSVQIQILNLLKELKRIYNLSYIFITHDLQAAAYICDRIIFFRSGQIEEIVETVTLKDAQSEYAKKLLQMHITI